MSADPKKTIGQAIDQTMNALSSLDKREQQIVLATVCSLLDIALASGRVEATSKTPPAPPAPAPGAPATSRDAASSQEHKPPAAPLVEAAIDIRRLKNEKQPANAQQMACVAAYYLMEHAPTDERSKEITSADLERLFKQAGYKLPMRPAQVLPDAKTAGYFESSDRGKYKLTRVGYNLVTHSLPKAGAA